MTLTVWDPFSVRNTRSTVAGFAFRPAADVVREGDDVVVTLELPGVDVDKDVSIEVRPGRLVITGQHSDSSEKKDEDGTVLRRERRQGSFRREFTLPRGVTSEAVEASYESGLLRIRVHQVTRPEDQPQKIAITTK